MREVLDALKVSHQLLYQQPTSGNPLVQTQEERQQQLDAWNPPPELVEWRMADSRRTQQQQQQQRQQQQRDDPWLDEVWKTIWVCTFCQKWTRRPNDDFTCTKCFENKPLVEARRQFQVEAPASSSGTQQLFPVEAPASSGTQLYQQVEASASSGPQLSAWPCALTTTDLSHLRLD